MKLPNILITGTPGTGKTQTSQMVTERLSADGYRHINVSELIKEHEAYEEFDEQFDTYVVDDDKVCDLLEPILEAGGCIVDFHSCELFPERWFELVIVLRVATEVLFDRLAERGYTEKKRTENMECEIMQVVLNEAQDSYDPMIVQELTSNTVAELESNVDRIAQWVQAWKSNHGL